MKVKVWLSGGIDNGLPFMRLEMMYRYGEFEFRTSKIVPYNYEINENTYAYKVCESSLLSQINSKKIPINKL